MSAAGPTSALRPDGLLRGHVAGRAGDHARGRRLGAGHEDFGQAEVGHIGLVVAVEEDVRRLQVAVDDAVGVQMLDRPGDDAHQPHDRVEGKRLAGDPLGQALAFDVFHGEVVLAVVLADVVDLRDVGVSQAGGGPGLDLKAADVLRRGQMRGQDHLHGHDAVERLLPRLVDHAHAAAADSSRSS